MGTTQRTEHMYVAVYGLLCRVGARVHVCIFEECDSLRDNEVKCTQTQTLAPTKQANETENNVWHAASCIFTLSGCTVVVGRVRCKSIAL